MKNQKSINKKKYRMVCNNFEFCFKIIILHNKHVYIYIYMIT